MKNLKILKNKKNFSWIVETNKVDTRSMATLKELKGRITSIRQISKITTSMKQVAAAKLKQQQTYTENARPFFEGISNSVVFKTSKVIEIPEKGKALRVSDSTPPEEGNECLWVVCTSDKGLCGSLNTVLTRPIKTLLTKNTKVVSLGAKGFNVFGDRNYDMWFLARDLGKDPLSFNEACLMADRILSSDRRKIYIFYNTFVNVLTSRPTINYVPSRKEILEKDLDDYEFEEPAAETRKHLADFYFACVVFHGCVENACSEIGARMTSMETASNNAKDIVTDLTIEYNSRRQAAINKELSELVGGSDTSR